jgi:hypothetical protein
MFEWFPARAFSLFLFSIAFGASTLGAADLSTYRGFQFGSSLSAAAEQAGMKVDEARLIHQRPALIQVLDVQRYFSHNSAAREDPVSQISLSFFNGELFRISVIYSRYKVDQMTPEDMIEGISATYGTAERPSEEIAYHSYYSEVAPVIARWEDSQYSYNLIRADNPSSFAMVLFSKRLDVPAQLAILEAGRLDALEAPQKEAERASKKAEETRVELEKSRLANKASFRP